MIEANKYKISFKVLQSLAAGNLFYPAAGNDVITPIQAFSSLLTDFWFVDLCYDQKPILSHCNGYRLVEATLEQVSGKTIKSGEPYEIMIYHQVYEHMQDERVINLHKCRGRGYDVFRTQFKDKDAPLSVFFYRGDGVGEGGSGFYWLGNKRLKNVLEVLEEGGLIATDGSNAIPQLKCRSGFPNLENKAVDFAHPFEFSGRHFECVGYLGERYGPTLVWQVRKT